MDIPSSPETCAHSPNLKRSSSDEFETDGFDGPPDDEVNLQYAYEEEMPSGLQTPANEESDQEVKRRKIERPTGLQYRPHMTMRGHKRGVAAVKFSPDGKWIASCCT